jgi:hypothetical protein
MVCGLRRAIAGLEKDETLKEWLFEQSKQMLLEIPEESSEQAEWWDKPLQLTYDPPPNEPLTLTHDNIPGVDVPDGIPLFPEAPAHADNPTGSEPIVGEAHNWANDPLTRRFVVSLSPPQVTIDGTAYALEDKAAEFLNGLMKDQDWVSGSSIVNQPSRVRDHMPPEVQRWIKSGSGKGFRITPPK